MTFIYFSQAYSLFRTPSALTFHGFPAILTIKKGDFHNMTRAATYVSPAQAVAAVRDGDYIDYGFGGSFPELLDNALAARTGSVRRVNVRGGLVIAPKIAVLEADPEGQSFRYESIHLGDYERKQYRAGRIAFVPIALRLVPFLYRQGKFRSDVAFVPVSRPDAEGNVSLGTGCYLWKTIIDCARTVIFEINEHLPFLPGVDGSNLCRLDEADMIVEGTHAPLSERTYRAPSEIDRRIAELVVNEIPDGAVLSLGVGTVPFAIASALADSDKKDLGCHTGTISDAYRKLYLAGKLTNARKEFDTGRSSFNLAMGSSDFYDWLRENPDLFRPDSIDYIHDPARIGKLSRVISINGGVQVDLMGQENAESANGMQLSGIGGQMDFLEGAFRSAGGCGYICINSSRLTKDGVRKSNILPFIPGGSTVSAPRTLIEAVATEYGIAHLAGKSLAERREAMIAIAHPDFRDALRLEKPDLSLFL